MTADSAEVKKTSKISGIWVIPLIALVLGVYMVIHTWMTEGPEITIAFDKATGLVQGKTKIKFRDVEMGVVESVSLNPDFDGVLATVKLDRQTLPLLRDDTRFWVVTAQIGLGNISGLDTLLSGAYIQMAPGVGKEGHRQYAALEHPPLTPTGAPGLRLHLSSKKASSVSAGDSVLYNGYKVGRVEEKTFSAEHRMVHYTLFVDAPYHELVNSSVRFWDISGISLSAGADGIKVDTGAMDTILLGGVAFGLPDNVPDGDPVEHGAKFKLYESYEDILTRPFEHGVHVVVFFDHSIRGLVPGAPVEFRGIQLGRVERILLKESMEEAVINDTGGQDNALPVLLYLEPGRMTLPDSAASVQRVIDSIVAGVPNGMRASLESGNLLTGAKFIAIDYFDGVETAQVSTFREWTTIPAIESGLGQIEQKLTAILDKINDLPLEDTVSNANTAIVTLNDTLQSLDDILENQSTQNLPEDLEATLEDLQSVLDGLAPGSEVYQSINSSLQRLNRTMSNVETFTRTLSQQPNSAIFPASSNPDTIPEARP